MVRLVVDDEDDTIRDVEDTVRVDDIVVTTEEDVLCTVELGFPWFEDRLLLSDETEIWLDDDTLAVDEPIRLDEVLLDGAVTCADEDEELVCPDDWLLLDNPEV